MTQRRPALRVGMRRHGWLVVAIRMSRAVLECIECGAWRNVGVSHAGHVKRCFHPVVDEWTAFEHDAVAQRLALEGPQTLDAISVVMNVTRERVRQIEERALRKLGVVGFGREVREQIVEQLRELDSMRGRSSAPEDEPGAGVWISVRSGKSTSANGGRVQSSSKPSPRSRNTRSVPAAGGEALRGAG